MGSRLSRRAFVLGAASPAILASARSYAAILPAEVAAQDPLNALGYELRAIRHRSGQLKRAYLRMEEIDDEQAAAAWQAWSESIDQGLIVAVRIDRARAISINGLAVKLEAAIFELCDAGGEDDSDNRIHRKLKALRRDALALSAAP